MSVGAGAGTSDARCGPRSAHGGYTLGAGGHANPGYKRTAHLRYYE